MNNYNWKIKIILMMLIFIPLRASILNIPDEFNTIQLGINASTDGDTIIVAAGNYNENIRFEGKNIILLSQLGAEQTTIDGTLSGSVVWFTGGETENAVIDGFTIQNGSGTLISLLFGGGILIQDGNPTLRNLIISNNTAFAGGGIAYHSIDNTELTPKIENCLIQNNFASEGGGIFCANISPVIENSQIIYNGMDENGSGGGLNAILAYPILQNVNISGNESKWGGGIYCTSGGINLENVIISNNISIVHGAGAWFGQNNYIIAEKVLLINNHAQSFGGGLWMMENNNVVLINMTISGNNSANGGGIYINNSELIILNSIIWDNYPQQALLDLDLGILNIAFSNIEGGENGIQINSGTLNWLNGNIFSNPQFNDVFELTNNSPCIDAGTAYFILEEEVILNLSETEFWGNAPDLGALEQNTSIYEGDVNNDGDINILDVVLIINSILTGEILDQNEFNSADLNQDEQLDVIDIIILISLILDN